jgi:hypothetical protein
MSTATIEWISKEEALIRSAQKQEQAFDKLLRKMDDLERQSKKATEATVTGFDSATAKVGQFVLGFAGVGSVMAAATASAAQLRREWETIKSQQSAAAQANLQLADVLPGTLRQAGGLLNARDIETSVSRISAQTGAGSVRVAQAIGEALAARGATNRAQAEEAISAASAALRFAPEADPQTIAALAGGTTDIQRRFGVSAEQAIGFFSRVGGQARVTSLREQVQNLNPAIGNLAAFGMNPQAAGGLVSVLTGATGDFTGAMSGTAAVQLAKQLEDRGFAPEAGIAAMQADPALRDRFFKGGRFGGREFAPASFEAKAYAAVREILTGGSALAQNLDAASREVGTFAQGGQSYDQLIREMNNFSSVRLANLQRSMTQGAEELRLRNIIGAEGSITREGFGDLLDASGAGALEKSFLTTEFEALSGGGTRTRLGDVATRLRRRAGQLTASEMTVSAGFQGATVPRNVTDQERAQAEVLNRVAGLLEQLNQVNEAQLSEMRAGKAEPRMKEPQSGGLAR